MAAIFHYQSKNYHISEILNQSSSANDESTSTLENNLEQKARSQRISRFLELLDNSKLSSVRKAQTTQDDATVMNVISNIQDNKGL